MCYRSLIRPLLFRIDAERVHDASIRFCEVFGRIPFVSAMLARCLSFRDPLLQCDVAGLRFENPLGLAAGWDKSGRACAVTDNLGFGFVEIGSISLRASRGNAKPRLFRLADEQAIVVNYGLPNDGLAIVAKRLSGCQLRHPLGVNIVKTNDGLEAACAEEVIFEEYAECVRQLHSTSSYLMLNLSCPNAKTGKDLFAQAGSIGRLLERLSAIQCKCPLFLKIAPCHTDAILERLLEECDPYDFVRGFCFNLPPGKPGDLRLSRPLDYYSSLPGAVAGRPVSQLIDLCISRLYQRMPQNRYAIIGSGGVFTAEDAYRKLRLGASLVQLYTALIFEGPLIASRINRGLCDLLRRDGCTSVEQAIGSLRNPGQNDSSV